MTISTENKQDILDAITQSISFYDIDKIIWNSGKPNTQVYTYIGRGIGSLMAQRVSDMMHEKYPEQDYEIRIRTGEVEITLL
jgi:hypothetical protein